MLINKIFLINNMIETTATILNHLLIMLSTIWMDVNHEAEAIVISDIKYEPSSLTNLLYEVIDDRTKRRKFLKQKKIKGLLSDLHLIRDHRDKINSDEDINMLVRGLFRPEQIEFITPLDCVFLNSYYRRLLRAKLEQDYIGKELVAGLVVSEYTNSETDAALVSALRVIRIVCKFLGIKSTTDAETFPLSKLYMPAFWTSVSSKFVTLFGERRAIIIEEDDQLPTTNVEAVLMHEGQKKIRQGQVLMLLNIVFNTWSGSILSADENTVTIVPATYVTRMLPKLR